MTRASLVSTGIGLGNERFDLALDGVGASGDVASVDAASVDEAFGLGTLGLGTLGLGVLGSDIAFVLLGSATKVASSSTFSLASSGGSGREIGSRSSA